MNFGLIKSNLVGDERHFYSTQPVGRQYNHRIDEIYNQGSDPICAACAVCTFLKWRFPDKNWDPWVIFREAGGSSRGISFKELLQYLRKKGIIQEYALIHSEQALKTAITVNGPCLAGMTVRDSRRPDFWNGTKQEGMHGVAIIGWNDKGFIIKNSWGDDWGKHGTTILPHERFSEFKEIWTVIA